MGEWWVVACEYRLKSRCIAGAMKLLARYINFSCVRVNSARMLQSSAMPQGQVSISASNESKFPAWFRVRFQPGTEPLQRVSTHNPLLKCQHFLLQLSIWVLIVSQQEQYVNCPDLVAPSPPAFRFAIRQVFVESRSKTRQFRFNSPFNLQPLNEYQSDRKSESGRWKTD